MSNTIFGSGYCAHCLNTKEGCKCYENEAKAISKSSTDTEELDYRVSQLIKNVQQEIIKRLTTIEKLEKAKKIMQDRRHEVAGLGAVISIISDCIDDLKTK